MKEIKRGFDGSGFDKKSHPDAKAPDQLLANETLGTRAIQVFAEATRRAADGARAAGLSIPGRIAGKRVSIAPDGTVTELPEGNKP
jgi:hypothetical protein